MYRSKQAASESSGPQAEGHDSNPDERDAYFPYYQTPEAPSSGYSRAPTPTYLPPPVPPVANVTSDEPVPHVAPVYGAMRGIRLWTHVPTERPIITQIIIGVLVAIYLPMVLFPSVNEAILNWGLKIGILIYDGQWYRLLSSAFLHLSIGGIPFIHLLFNCYGIYIIGMELEAFFGKWKYLTIYMLSALAGGVSSFAFLFNVPAAGASGALFGLVGALAVYFGLNRKVFGRVGQAQFWNMILVIALNLGLGLSNILPVDNSAHIGGLVAGALVGFALCPRYAFGEWETPQVRRLVNINRGAPQWLLTVLVALIIVFGFFLTLLLYKNGVLSMTGTPIS